jgi:2-phosphosulfolactate phosphatase
VKARVVPEARAMDPARLADQIVVVIDTLRATTSIACAVARGAAVEPVGSVAAAKRARGPRAPIAGERGGKRLPGFDFGNSPVELIGAQLAGKTLILTTTNGTGAVARSAGAKAIYSGAIVNAGAIARAVAPLLSSRELVLVCAGRTTGVALEDLCGAGAILDALLPAAPDPRTLTDGVRLSLELFRRERLRLPDFLLECESGRNLVRIGNAADVAYCAQVDALDVAPVLRRGRFRV